MKQLTRRQLAIYAKNRLLAGDSPKSLARRLASELSASGRRRQTGLLIDDFYAELENTKLLSRAEVTTARPITGQNKTAVEKLVKNQTGVEKCEIVNLTDESLISGLIIKTPGYSYDGSVKTMLKRIGKA